MPRRNRRATATILISGTVSDAIQLGSREVIVGVILPATFTGTGLSFQVSDDNATFGALVDTAGANVGATGLTAGKCFSIDPVVTAPWNFVKVVSNAAEAAQRLVTLIIQTLD
jgi:hypothetical protein